MTEVNAGTVRAFLKLDASDWNAELQKAGVAADELGAHDPNIQISVEGAAKALAALETVTRAENAVTNANVRVSRAEQDLAAVRAAGASDAAKISRAESELAMNRARSDTSVELVNRLITDEGVAGV